MTAETLIRWLRGTANRKLPGAVLFGLSVAAVVGCAFWLVLVFVRKSSETPQWPIDFAWHYGVAGAACWLAFSKAAAGIGRRLVFAALVAFAAAADLWVFNWITLDPGYRHGMGYVTPLATTVLSFVALPIVVPCVFVCGRMIGWPTSPRRESALTWSWGPAVSLGVAVAPLVGGAALMAIPSDDGYWQSYPLVAGGASAVAAFGLWASVLGRGKQIDWPGVMMVALAVYPVTFLITNLFFMIDDGNLASALSVFDRRKMLTSHLFSEAVPMAFPAVVALTCLVAWRWKEIDKSPPVVKSIDPRIRP
ncbi:hypothetical protein L2U69_03110 [Zavarzinia compransoris]|uniref:hypothetical protein n=1 Tax=Zavarzinia marina TaxID=2911065 RepID=UPI001F3CF85D|nr:hypothetical protein [Zavarzinia marina]MCF4164633.1 hypothetical protein [Zavarzinia marina]